MRREVEHLGVLGAVRMLGAGVDAQVAHLLAAERAAREHPLDRLLDHPLGEAALEDLAGGAELDAARIAGVPVVALVGALVAGQLHLLGVDDDDVVAHVHVRREGRLVLAAQDLGDDGWRAGRARRPRRRSAPTSCRCRRRGRNRSSSLGSRVRSGAGREHPRFRTGALSGRNRPRGQSRYRRILPCGFRALRLRYQNTPSRVGAIASIDPGHLQHRHRTRAAPSRTRSARRTDGSRVTTATKRDDERRGSGGTSSPRLSPARGRDHKPRGGRAGFPASRSASRRGTSTCCPRKSQGTRARRNGSRSTSRSGSGCSRVFAWFALNLVRPFIPLLLWSVILTVAFYPVFGWLRARLGGRSLARGAAADRLRVGIVAGPTTILLSSLIDSLEVIATLRRRRPRSTCHRRRRRWSSCRSSATSVDRRLGAGLVEPRGLPRPVRPPDPERRGMDAACGRPGSPAA